MASVALVGATGMVGSIILSTLRESASIGHIYTLARRPLATPSDKVREYTNADTSTWSSHISSVSPPPSIFFSSLATTRAAAGGLDKQYKIEHDLNVELAKTAKAAGTQVYVLISATGANAKSMVPYNRMKGEIEDHIKELDFDHTVIVQPGMIAGERQESRPAEAVFRKLAGVLGRVSNNVLKDFWAQDADVIARAAVSAGLQALDGKAPDKVWVLQGPVIIRLGRTEWGKQS